MGFFSAVTGKIQKHSHYTETGKYVLSRLNLSDCWSVIKCIKGGCCWAILFHVSYLLRRLSPPLPKHRTQTLPAPVRKWSEATKSLWLQHFPIQQALTSPRGNLTVRVAFAKWSRVIDLLQGHDRGFYNVYLMWKRQTTNAACTVLYSVVCELFSVTVDPAL